MDGRCVVAGCDGNGCGDLDGGSFYACAGCAKGFCNVHIRDCGNVGCITFFPWCKNCLIPCTVEGCTTKMCNSCSNQYICDVCDVFFNLCPIHKKIHQGQQEVTGYFCSNCMPSPGNIKGD